MARSGSKLKNGNRLMLDGRTGIFLDDRDEIAACLGCRLPDCYEASPHCALKALRAEKRSPRGGRSR